jgi:predicted transcriptional regulator
LDVLRRFIHPGGNGLVTTGPAWGRAPVNRASVYNAVRYIREENPMGMTSVRVPDDMLSRLESTAARLRRSKGWIINDALREYLEREERRVQRLAETRQALGEVDAGDLVEGDEVLAWLDSWGVPDEHEAPR